LELWAHDQDFDHEGYEAERKKLAKRLDEQGPGPEYYDGPLIPAECSGDRRGQSGRNPAGKRVQYLRDLNIEKRGVVIGRARTGTPLPGQKAKKIRRPAANKISAVEQKIEKGYGPLVPADTSVHTIATRDVELKLDRMAWDELGYAKRKASPVTDPDKDDPGNWS
jgi:hypothetical protein